MKAPALVVLVAIASMVGAWRSAAQAPAGAFVIRDVRVFDGERATEGQTVVVNGGVVTSVGTGTVSVPPGAEEVDGTGRTLLPGLIDAHVHFGAFYADQALQQSLVFGVTTVVDMWTGRPPPGFAGTPAMVRLKQMAAEDSPLRAAVRTAGAGATAKGGHPTQMDGGAGALATPTLETPGEADAFVAARVAEGSDFLKIIHDDTSIAYGRSLPTLSEATVAALAAAAHARGKIAVAHIGSERQARGAIAAGVDGLVHVFLGPPPAPDFAELVRARGTFVAPTLTTMYGVCGMSDGPGILGDPATMRYVREPFKWALTMTGPEKPPSCEGARAAVRDLIARGATVIAGTDTPAPGTTYGASLHLELEHLVDLGMSPAAALAAATSRSAQAFRMTDRGRIAPAMRADLLLVEGDPTTDIRATRRIVRIWKTGVSVVR